MLNPDAWADQDPFITLMDDRIDGLLRAGPHPHAGFETVTFPLEGGMESEAGLGRLQPGDVEWTTAGSGIIHGPDRPIKGRFRLLQLWVTPPRGERWTAPDYQIIKRDSAPVRRRAGVEIRLYSGSTGDLISTTKNRVPMTVLDVRLENGAMVEQALPTTYSAFLYVLEGEARIGEARTPLCPTQVGWLDPPPLGDRSVVMMANEGPQPMRLIFCAGERQNIPIVSHGPFIGDTPEAIARSFERYRARTFRRY